MQIGTGLQSCVLKEIIYILKEKQKISHVDFFSPQNAQSLFLMKWESGRIYTGKKPFRACPQTKYNCYEPPD